MFEKYRDQEWRKQEKDEIKPHVLGAAYHIGKCCKT